MISPKTVSGDVRKHRKYNEGQGRFSVLIPEITSCEVTSYLLTTQSTCQDVVKEEKVLEREALSVTGKFFVITSRVSPSQPSVVLLAEVV